METYTTQSREETQALGRRLAEGIVPGTLITFSGNLGAGKTALIQGILEGCGALAPYPSPTFVLMNQYELSISTITGVKRVYHADAYRVGATDFEKLGFLEWCADPEGLVLLEWPERLAEILPAKRVEVSIQNDSETERTIRVKRME